MLNRELLLEYESTLIGKKKCISQYFFKSNANANMAFALGIIKYAVETYLRWDPYEVRDLLTLEALDHLKIKYLLRYIKFPPELDPKKDLFFIAWQLYPETINYSAQDLILRVYQDILSKKNQKFPKGYFSDINGYLRASVCLKYMIEQYLTFKSVDDLYALFASPAAVATLKKYKLNVICKDMFDSPLEYLHYSLPETQKDDFLYKYYLFTMQLRERDVDQLTFL